MKQPGKSIDGFAPRRPAPTVTPARPTPSAARPQPRPVVKSTAQSSASLQDLDASLRAMDQEMTVPKNAKRRRHFFGRRTKKPPMTRRKKIILLVVVVVLVLAAASAGYFVYKALSATSKIVHGDLLSLVQPDTPLKKDSEGRTNILIFGTSQDDKAHQQASGGGGLWLTDSIMLISINQETKKVHMVSIPRDLWVSIPGGCSVGYQAKINAVYECGSDLVYDDGKAGDEPGYEKKDRQGAAMLSSVIQTVTGITPQYYAHVNYSVLKESIDAVGGVDVAIVGDGADGIYDTNFDWNCPSGPYTCKHVYYPKNGTYTLDGQAALYLARARSDGGKYSYKNFGLNRGDYDRQANQQKILQALQQKASSTGTLANPLKVTSLLTALGNNVTTDFEGGELKTLIKLAKDIKSSDMKSISLVAEGESVIASRTISGQSAQIATSGLLNYASIKQYVTKQFAVKKPTTADASKIQTPDATSATSSN